MARSLMTNIILLLTESWTECSKSLAISNRLVFDNSSSFRHSLPKHTHTHTHKGL